MIAMPGTRHLVPIRYYYSPLHAVFCDGVFVRLTGDRKRIAAYKQDPTLEVRQIVVPWALYVKAAMTEERQ